MTLNANSVRGGSSLSGTQCFTIDEGSAQREDVCGTVSGTSVSSLVRGVDPLTGTTTNATLQFQHRRGAQVKITDFPLIQIMRNQLAGSETIPRPITYTSGVTPFGAYDLASKGYVDGLAFSGIITGPNFPQARTLVWYDGTNLRSTSTNPLYVDNLSATSTTATSTFAGAVSIASSTPFAGFTVGGGNGSSTKSILVAENQVATSSSFTINWLEGNSSLVRLGNAAVTISFSNFTDGAQKKVIVCNPPTGTAGTITWGTQILWLGGIAPTQTTTATHCDVWSFTATQATSSLKVFGAQSANF